MSADREVLGGGATRLKVPGGWVYTFMEYDGRSMAAVFVPELSADNALVAWLKDNVKLCGHGYVETTCAPCWSQWAPR